MPEPISHYAGDTTANIQVTWVESKLLECGWQWHNALSLTWRLYWNDEDGMALRIQTRRFPIPRRKMVLVPVSIRFTEETTARVNHLYIHFNLHSHLFDSLSRTLRAPVILDPTPAGESLAEMVLGRSLAMGNPDPALLCRVQALVQESLAVWLDSLPEDRKKSASETSDSLRAILPALQGMDNAPSRHFRNGELAARCHMSESHFTRCFRAAMGKSPHQFALASRLQRAANDLVYTELTVDEIAVKNGFANRYYFTRMFKQHSGQPPAAFRVEQRFKGSKGPGLVD